MELLQILLFLGDFSCILILQGERGFYFVLLEIHHLLEARCVWPWAMCGDSQTTLEVTLVVNMGQGTTLSIPP